MKPISGGVIGLVVLVPVVGCAPLRLTEGVAYTAERYGVRDAAALTVAQGGHLRFDTALRSDLDDTIAATDFAEVKKWGADVLARANALAISSVSGEIDRMPDDGITSLVRTYKLRESGTDAAARRKAVQAAFEEAARAAVERDLATLSSAKNVQEARRFLSRIRGAIEVAAGDRGKAGRILLGAPLFIPASIGAEIAEREAMQREVVVSFEKVAEYRPFDMNGVPGAAALAEADTASLARWYAPVFLQEVDSGADYPSTEDQIGRIYLTGTPGRIRVNVDISDPVVYWTHLEAKIGSRKYDQLVYVAWYPSRPALSPNDPEAGRIDGVVLRITLDRHKRPAVYEFVRSCGCYHTLWVSEFVESAARTQFGHAAKDQRFAVQRPLGGKELFFPDLIRDDGAHPRRPIAFVSGGHHLLMGVRPIEEGVFTGDVTNQRTYRLEPYETLAKLPLGDGVASMFGSDGLVHDAGRGEGWLLAPTGMLSAGQPRQLGTMKIRMDAYDYDDPRLLERNLRFPDRF